MYTTIKGYFEQGQVFLYEPSPVDSKTEVIITLLSEEIDHKAAKLRTPGGLKGKVTIPDNFNEPLDDLKEYL